MTVPLSLEIVRKFAAPLDRVWDAWTNPAEMTHWMSPPEADLISAEGEAEPGGDWRIRMKGHDGTDYIAFGAYQIVEPMGRIVFSHRWERADGSFSPETLVTVTLEEVGGETQMTFQQVGFESEEVRDMHVEGWSGCFDILAERLGHQSFRLNEVSVEDGEQPSLHMRRLFAHDIATMWAMITEKRHLERWTPFSPDRDLDSVGPFRLTMTDGDSPEVYDEEVTAAERPSVVEYTWGGDVLTWRLVETESGTELHLRNQVSSPEWLTRVAAGWHLCLQALDDLATHGEAKRVVGAEAEAHGWSGLEARYANALGRPSAGMPERTHA
jgi:uncharacterized protein YndB with AHSA1/START domain